ncbi:phage replication initiation protein [Coprococcus sp. TF11-13]|jgi:hypothetical protein|uniref:phage replication initiation protein n=1 Tax=Coprococcus sp. TF11-13 TaxID=2293096 RepID=UPI0018F625A4|nr:phage replication initiation protein [Coprococcus sp. TF11-13]
MARRRMFSLDVVDTDKFMDMPPTTQNLYFHLGMRADDDGFVSSPKKVAMICGSCATDLQLLVSNDFIIPFENGVILITDWKANNYLRKDRYTESRFKEYLDTVEVDNDKYIVAASSTSLTCGIPKDNQTVDKRHTDGCHRLGKDRVELGKDSKSTMDRSASGKDVENQNVKDRKHDQIKYSDDPELDEAIHEFIKFRKGVKKPMSDRAITLMINKLESLSHDKHEQVQILNQSIMQGWTGLYALKDDDKSRGQSRSVHNNQQPFSSNGERDILSEWRNS